MGVFTDRSMSAAPHTLSPKEGHHEIHAVSVRRMGKAYTKDNGKARHIFLRGGGCRNGLLPMVVLHHSYITQWVAEVMTSPHNTIKGFGGKPLPPMIQDGRGSREQW